MKLAKDCEREKKIKQLIAKGEKAKKGFVKSTGNRGEFKQLLFSI